MEDLKSRLAGRIQLSTDGHQGYVTPVGLTFKQDIDWAQIQKTYATEAESGRYSPDEGGLTIKRTPAMATGVTDNVWTLKEIAALLD
jgi:hypothetical protein